MATNHVVSIILTGVSPGVLAANPNDTVQWKCPSGNPNDLNLGYATGASITFTGSTPFTSGPDGTINITNSASSSTYTIRSNAKSATYSYKVVAKLEGQAHGSFTASIQVTDAAIISDGDGVIEIPLPTPPTIPDDLES